MSRWGPATVQQVTQDTGADEQDSKRKRSRWGAPSSTSEASDSTGGQPQPPNTIAAINYQQYVKGSSSISSPALPGQAVRSAYFPVSSSSSSSQQLHYAASTLPGQARQNHGPSSIEAQYFHYHGTVGPQGHAMHHHFSPYTGSEGPGQAGAALWQATAHLSHRFGATSSAPTLPFAVQQQGVPGTAPSLGVTSAAPSSLPSAATATGIAMHPTLPPSNAFVAAAPLVSGQGVPRGGIGSGASAVGLPPWIREHPAWAAGRSVTSSGGVTSALDPGSLPVGHAAEVLGFATKQGLRRPVAPERIREHSNTRGKGEGEGGGSIGSAAATAEGTRGGTTGAAQPYWPPVDLQALARVPGAVDAVRLSAAKGIEPGRLEAKLKEFYRKAEGMRRRWARKAEKLAMEGGADQKDQKDRDMEEEGHGDEDEDGVVGALHGSEGGGQLREGDEQWDRIMRLAGASHGGASTGAVEPGRSTGVGDSSLSAPDHSGATVLPTAEDLATLANACLGRAAIDGVTSEGAARGLLAALDSPARPLPAAVLPSRLQDVGVGARAGVTSADGDGQAAHGPMPMPSTTTKAGSSSSSGSGSGSGMGMGMGMGVGGVEQQEQRLAMEEEALALGLVRRGGEAESEVRKSARKRREWSRRQAGYKQRARDGHLKERGGKRGGGSERMGLGLPV